MSELRPKYVGVLRGTESDTMRISIDITEAVKLQNSPRMAELEEALGRDISMIIGAGLGVAARRLGPERFIEWINIISNFLAKQVAPVEVEK